MFVCVSVSVHFISFMTLHFLFFQFICLSFCLAFPVCVLLLHICLLPFPPFINFPLLPSMTTFAYQISTEYLPVEFRVIKNVPLFSFSSRKLLIAPRSVSVLSAASRWRSSELNNSCVRLGTFKVLLLATYYSWLSFFLLFFASKSIHKKSFMGNHPKAFLSKSPLKAILHFSFLL